MNDGRGAAGECHPEQRGPALSIAEGYLLFAVTNRPADRSNNSAYDRLVMLVKGRLGAATAASAGRKRCHEFETKANRKDVRPMKDPRKLLTLIHVA